MALEIPHIRVADDKQTQNLDRLKPWADGVDEDIAALQVAPPPHAANHSLGGTDPIPQPDLGASFGTPGHAYVGGITHTADRVYLLQVVIPVTATISGIAYRVGGASSGNVRSALYNAGGSKVADRTSGVAQSSAQIAQGVAFDNAYVAAPGVYYMALVFSSSSSTSYGQAAMPAAFVTGPGSGATAASITPPAATANADIPVMRTF